MERILISMFGDEGASEPTPCRYPLPALNYQSLVVHAAKVVFMDRLKGPNKYTQLKEFGRRFRIYFMGGLLFGF